jgi:acyl-CoA thioesterase-2
MSRVKELVDLLDLEIIDDHLFRGLSRDLGGRSVYGGQVVSQALVAGARTVPGGAVPHSLHAYFLRPGDMNHPIIYEVDPVRDGRSFTTRRVQAIQHGAVILTMIASFQQPDAGWEHQAEMPKVPPPESLPSDREIKLQLLDKLGSPSPRLRQLLTQDTLFDIRYVTSHEMFDHEPHPPYTVFWFRTVDRLPDDPNIHRCVLAYASDFGPLSTTLLPHGKGPASPELRMASIDHAIWFHREARVDDWMLYVIDSPSSQNVRGLSFGNIFARDGRLVASTAQEGLVRVVPPES